MQQTSPTGIMMMLTHIMACGLNPWTVLSFSRTVYSATRQLGGRIVMQYGLGGASVPGTIARICAVWCASSSEAGSCDSWALPVVVRAVAQPCTRFASSSSAVEREASIHQQGREAPTRSGHEDDHSLGSSRV